MLPSKDFFKKYAEERNIPWQDRNILLEYLQTQILKALSLSKFNDSISFMGGACLRFAYGINRFSEDLYFDLVKKEGFHIEELMADIRNKLDMQGFQVDARTKTTENIHTIYFRFKDVLWEFGLNVQENEKMLIKFEIDFNPFKKARTETKFSDSFNERFPLLVNSLETLFAQKVVAIIFRPYQKGRDFYDLVWFLSQKDLEPNYALFKEKKLDITNRHMLVEFLTQQARKSNLEQAAKDVERFLFYPEQAKWILKLPEYLQSFEK
ncbi:MAG: nucleotidyl transferase AbiEii/AbiGii toxin family protein [Candidatus Moranbacteria bacterium]|nr:nucleotidyl transferase AbiEii/AbiGii toxin family protein [Candidatus Moranbacteria bacterium]